MEHDPPSESWMPSARKAFETAVRKAGGQVAFANICRCTQGNVSQLLRRGSLLTERFVLKVEAATGISRHDLRPDIYPRSHKPFPDDIEPPFDCSPVMSSRLRERQSNLKDVLDERSAA